MTVPAAGDGFKGMDCGQFKAMIGLVGLTQREFAHLAGVTYNTVSRWCSSKAVERMPPAHYAIALLNAYEIMHDMQRDRFVRRMNTLIE